MTPEESDEFQQLIRELEQSPGFRIERYEADIRTIGAVFLDNATELEAALVIFREPQARGLFATDKRADLNRFLLLATRRLYNHLATACSSVEHAKAVTRRLPDELAVFRERMMQMIKDFERAPTHQLDVRLRDYSVHRMLNLTHATATFDKSAPSMSTDLSIHLDKVRAETYGRRRQERRKVPLPDPIRDLPDEVALYPLFVKSRDGTKGLLEQLLAGSAHEYRQHGRAVESIRARMREIYGANPGN